MQWFMKFGALAVASLSLSVSANPFAGYRAVDLTHAFDENTIYWPTEKGFQPTAQPPPGIWRQVPSGFWFLHRPRALMRRSFLV